MYKSLMVASMVLMIFLVAFVANQFGGSRQPVVPASSQSPSGKLSVVTTFYPLAEFARAVGGEYAEVVSIVPSGVEPHDYEPKPGDIIALQTADVVVINGAGFDSWAQNLKPELESKGISVLVMSEVLNKEQESKEEVEHAEEDEHKHGSVDPHFWLDPIMAQKQIEALRDSFVVKNESAKQIYAANADAAVRQLADLDEAYRQGLTNCSKRIVVTSHDAFRYLGDRYNFQTLAIAGLSPEEEPSPRRLAEVARVVRQQGIQYVFFESLVSPRLSEALARETGTKTLIFNPLEGLTDDEVRSGANYFSVMRQNLNNLQTALQCQSQ